MKSRLDKQHDEIESMNAILNSSAKPGFDPVTQRPGLAFKEDEEDADMEINESGPAPGHNETILDVKIVSADLHDQEIVNLLNT